MTDDSPSRETNIRMITACKTGDVATVRELLADAPALADCENPIGRFQPLHYAVRAGHTEVVEALLQAGANPNPFEHMLRNHCGTTTIELARLRGYNDIVVLLENVIASKHHAPSGDEPMREAMRGKNTERIVELVNESSQRVHATDDDGNTPLHLVAEARPVNLRHLEALLGHGADIKALNFLGFSPLHVTLLRNHAWTCKRDDWRAAGFLLSRGADYNICIAAAAGDTAKVRELLQSDQTLANFQDTNLKRPLSCAAEFGHWDIVKLLLENGADPNASEAPPYRTFPLYVAAQQNNLEMVKLLLEHGADAEAYVDAGGGALFKALEHGHTDVADLLASHGASLSPADYAWKCDIPVLSALLKANPTLAPELLAYNDESKPEKSAMVVRLAFKFGADPKKVGNWTLYRAVGAPSLLKEFLEHGVNPNTADQENKTSLHGINRDSVPNLESAALLLDYGADINARDDIHEATPLGWAALFGRTDMVRFLLSRGARPTLPDDKPWNTPLFWAKTRGHEDIVKLLEESGA